MAILAAIFLGTLAGIAASIPVAVLVLIFSKRKEPVTAIVVWHGKL